MKINEFPTDLDRSITHKTLYFPNETVEWQLTKYIWTGCTDVGLRDQIMSNATELIRQIIRKQGLHTIYPGHEESAFGDLLQTAWVQIERILYKYRSRPYCRLCYRPDKPSDSLLYIPGEFEYGIKTFKETIDMHNGVCPKCSGLLLSTPIVEPTQGRFGGSESILFRGMSKVFNMWCISPDTMLLSNKGFTTIGEFVDDEMPFVYGALGFKPVNGYLEKPLQEALKITTLWNYNITTSEEHLLMSLDSNGPTWKHVGDIKVGDLLGMQYDQQVFFNHDNIDDINLEKRGEWTQPKLLNDELAYIIGLFIAEGSYSYNKLVIYNIDQDVIDILVNNNLGLNFIHEPKFQRISLCNVRFIEFLNKFGFGERTSCETKHIPRRILRASKSIIASVLMGMFDGDGHSRKSDGCVGYTSISKILINQLRVILLNFGLFSKLTETKGRLLSFKNNSYTSETSISYQLLLPSEYSFRFYVDIGFNIARKQANASEIPDEMEIMGRIHCVNDKFRSLYEKYGSGTLGYESIRTLLKGSYCKYIIAKDKLQSWLEHSDDEDFKFIADRLDEREELVNKILWLPVVKIEETETELREISVDSEDHSYIANGFVSHNSQVARTVILAYIKKEGRDRRNSNTYKGHLSTKQRPISDTVVRFLGEAREICKYNHDYLAIIVAMETLITTDDRPHDGIIGKLVQETGLSRSIITSFMRHIKLRSFEFTDSPLSRNSESPDSKIDKRKSRQEFEDD